MSEDEQVDCMNCGYPLEECDCGGCQLCGGSNCEHMEQRAAILLRGLAAAIEITRRQKEEEK